jgi:hypothetical protein
MAEDKSNCFFVFLKPAVLVGYISFDKKTIQSPMYSAVGSWVNDLNCSHRQGIVSSGMTGGKGEVGKQQIARCHARRRHTPPGLRPSGVSVLWFRLFMGLSCR